MLREPLPGGDDDAALVADLIADRLISLAAISTMSGGGCPREWLPDRCGRASASHPRSPQRRIRGDHGVLLIGLHHLQIPVDVGLGGLVGPSDRRAYPGADRLRPTDWFSKKLCNAGTMAPLPPVPVAANSTQP